MPTHRCTRHAIKQRAECQGAECPSRTCDVIRDWWHPDFNDAGLPLFCTDPGPLITSVDDHNAPVDAFATAGGLRGRTEVFNSHCVIGRDLFHELDLRKPERQSHGLNPFSDGCADVHREDSRKTQGSVEQTMRSRVKSGASFLADRNSRG